MDNLCNLLSQTHLSNEININDLTNLMNKINLNDELYELNNLFSNMNILDDEIICIANKSNNLTEFCLFFLNIIKQRNIQRCYKYELISNKQIY